MNDHIQPQYPIDLPENTDHAKQTQISPHKINFKHLAEALPQIVWTSCPDGTLDYISPQWEVFTSIEKNDPEFLDWAKRVHPEDLEQTAEKWAHSLHTGEIYEQEFRLRSGDGTYHWFSVRAIPVKDRANNIIKWYGATTDIDRQKTAEQNLLDTADRKDKFIAMLGHELRNPLATISTSYEILQNNQTSLEQRNAASDLLGRQIEHLKRIVDDTLDISRLNSGKLQLVTAKLEINQLVTECVEDIRTQLEDNGLIFSIDLAPEEIWVDGDHVRLAQCLYNLLSNAIKFTQPGGKVTISIGHLPTTNQVQLVVADTGMGMIQKDIDRLFEPFEQGRSAARLSKDGLGLGLAVIQKLISLHKGSVKAKSEGQGLGTEFTLTLPTTSAPESREEEAEVVSERAKQHVMIIEDNQSVAKSLEIFFELDGHDVSVAADGEEAFNLLEKNTPDIIFCDLTLPGYYKGWDIAEKICASYPGDKIPYLIALSGHAQPQHIEKSLKAGFHQHMAKPPSPDQLRQGIMDALEYSNNQ